MANDTERRRVRRVQKRAQRKARRDATARTALALPETLEETLAYIQWPHKNRVGKWDSWPLTAIQKDYLANRTIARLNDEGGFQYGADTILKTRQCFFTTLVLSILIDCMIRYPGFQAVTVFHNQGKDSRKLFNRMLGAMSRLPAEWGKKTGGGISGSIIEWSNGSTWSLYTAGSGEDIAEGVGIGNPIHGLHLSEFGKYRYPDTLLGVVRPALADNGWMVAECTPPRTKEHLHYQEYEATRDGHGSFLKAFFYPWYRHEGRSLGESDPRYAKVMAEKFVKRVGPPEIEKEAALELTDGQIAWRRANFFLGTASSVRKAKRENPEDDSTCFGFDEVVSFFDPEALDAAEAMIRAPELLMRHTPQLKIRIFDQEPTGHLVVGCDEAFRNSRTDFSASVVVDQETRDLVAVIHGKCIPAEHAQALKWLLLDHFQRGPHEYIVCPETNRDCGLVDALKTEGLQLFYRRFRNRKTRRMEKSKNPGIGVNYGIKGEMINLMSYWLEGDELGEDIELAPQCDIPSAQLIAELRVFVDKGNKIEAEQGYNDDITMAWGIALWCAHKVKPRYSAPSSARAENRPMAHDRTRASRRGGGPK